jgi:hypothetical protein
MDQKRQRPAVGPGAQRELFGLAVSLKPNFSKLPTPCARCGATIGFVGTGAGPHFARLVCSAGHFQRWLPKPKEGGGHG